MPGNPKFTISPPILNSACPWASTFEDLKALYECPYTGAVTTRTSLLEGFNHNASTHQHIFFQAGQSLTHRTTTPQSVTSTSASNAPPSTPSLSSLNTYGYSPTPLSTYLEYITRITTNRPSPTSKPFILSVTGPASTIAKCHSLISSHNGRSTPLAMEINLSCPNIHGKPPPAYEREGLLEYLHAVRDAVSSHSAGDPVPVGIKLPPYTYLGQFEMVVACLKKVAGVVGFVTCTNTLGSSLVVYQDDGEVVLKGESGTGVGGLAGAALHHLALGNVATFRRLLDREGLGDVLVIGVGGVEDRDGFERMKRVGAGAVGCATALGRFGVSVFERIAVGGL